MHELQFLIKRVKMNASQLCQKCYVFIQILEPLKIRVNYKV